MNDEDKFFRALWTFRAKTNNANKHVSLQFDLSFENALPISAWLEVAESEKVKCLQNPEQWHLSVFQVLEIQQ